MHAARRVQRVRFYMRQVVLPELALHDHVVRISRRYADHDCYAAVFPYGAGHLILLCSNFFSLRPHVQRDTLVHEALHILWAEQDKRLESAVGRYLEESSQREELFDATVAGEHKAIGVLCPIVARRLTLPDFSKG